MKTIQFVSHLGPMMEAFCTLKRLANTDYQGQARLLSYFDQFIAKNHFPQPYLTRESIDLYMCSISHLNPRGWSNRLSVIRQFCKYLSQHQPMCYIPDFISKLQSYQSLQPYIFKLDEMKAFMAAARNLPPINSYRGETLATLYGLLYTTGLRIGEALALDIDDFFPDTFRLFVRQGKFRKARWVPLMPSACDALKRYLSQHQEKSPWKAPSPLFLNLRGKRLSYLSVRVPFRDLLKQCGISYQWPRIHDLRHSFAVNRVLQWYHLNSDVNSQLPALATYMGHVNIASTQHYLKATPELMQEANQRAWNYFNSHVQQKGGVS